MTVHIGFVNLYTTVTTDDNISIIAKVTIHIGFINLCAAVLQLMILILKNYCANSIYKFVDSMHQSSANLERIVKKRIFHFPRSTLKLMIHGILHYLWSVNTSKSFSQFRSSSSQILFEIVVVKIFADSQENTCVGVCF